MIGERCENQQFALTTMPKFGNPSDASPRNRISTRSQVTYHEDLDNWICVLNFCDLRNRLPEGLKWRYTMDGFIITSKETLPIAIAVPKYITGEDHLQIIENSTSSEIVFKYQLLSKRGDRCSQRTFCFCEKCVKQVDERQRQISTDSIGITYNESNEGWRAIVTFGYLNHGFPEGLNIRESAGRIVLTSQETLPVFVNLPGNVAIQNIHVIRRPNVAELEFRCNRRSQLHV
ncbi:uncharacterized protein LOC142351968 [Convolutriloba macropyga]|uniref:uncharacterized protein LOC142351968 n=1 Tax=Convolutriloba macropyga TaxID=536237 RepID=UPI003F5267C5